MADYGVKYRFRWNDEGGGDWRIDICQAGYTGDILPRAIGASSVSLRRDRNGNICGTSLELTAECRVDEEFAELYTTDPFEFKVLVYAESVCIWTGYVTPELYSEPFIAPPYDVKVTASDNLGELKLTEWVGVGRLTFAQLLNTLLAQTGLSMGVKYISTLATGSISARAFFSTVTIDLDELSGKSYYDVLDQLLASFHAVIFQHGGSWVVLRETDVVPSISGGAVVPVGQLAGMPIRSLGSAYAGGLWPENHVDLTVEPAKKAISLICPELWNRCGTASITNPSSGNATGTLIATFAAADGINLNDSSTTSRYPLALNIEALRKNRSNKVYYDVVVKVQGNGVTRYLVENTDAAEGYAWQSSSASIKITPGDKLYYAGRGDVSASKSGEVTSIPFPNCDDITALTKIEVTLTSNTIATSYRPTRYLPSVYFFGAWISYDDQFTSLMDTIAINNNARGAASDVNLIVSGLTDVALEKYFISNSLLDGSGSLLGAVHTSAFEGQDYISLLSRDYALSIAAPRLKAEGVFYGQERTDLPLFMSMGGLRYVIETWDWNLITGGVDFSALTLPAATITVTSETIVTGDNLGHGSSSGSGGSGGSSSSGAGYVAPGTGVPALTEAYIGTTRVQPSPTEDQDLTGIGNATLSGKLNLPQGAYLEVVNVGTTANPVYAIHTNIGLYSDGFISAFGASDTGGSGGGLIARVYGTSGFGGTYSDTDYTNTFNAYAINTLYDRIVALEGASVNISVNVTGSGNAVTTGSYNNGVITLTKGATFLTSVAFADLTAHPTTLAGYGITDAKIQNGVITLGGNTITPMTSIGAGSVTNAMLANSAITINGSSTALGGSFATADITAGTAGTSSATSGLSIAIPYVTLNKYGIVTAYGTHTHSISKANITSAIGSTTYAPYNSAGYLPLNGGVMTGPISGVTYLSVNRAAQTTYRLDVNGTSRLAGNTSVTGTLSVLGAATFSGGVTVDSTTSIKLGGGELTWDGTNSAWKLTGNLYATGFISAFGASDTGGGGGGIDLSAMWANLQVNESGTTGYNLQINPGHLTTALGTYVNGITTTGSGNAITAVSKSGSTLTFTKGSTFLTSHQSLANYVTLNSAQTISAVKTFSAGLVLNTGSSWTSSDCALYFASPGNNSILRYYNVDASTGLTYNPNTGALKAGSFVKRGGTSSQFLKADGSVDSSVYLTTATAADTYLPLAGGTIAGVTTMPKLRITTKHSSSSTSGGIYYYNGSTDYLLIGQGTSNLWIGANETAGTHHTGSTYISGGDGSVYFSRLVSSIRTNYLALDAGNYSSYALPLSGGTMRGNIVFAKSGSTTDGFPILALSSITGGWGRAMYSVTYDDTSIFSIGVYGAGSNFSFAYLGSNSITGDNLRIYPDKVQFGNNVIWHAGNDGASSGLDADLLDGQHGSYYATAAQLTNGSVTKVGTATVGGTAKPIYLNAGTPAALSATVGSSKMPVYLNAGTISEISSFPEAYLSWGGRNFSGGYGPIDAAMVGNLGACRTMFAKAAGISIEYSTDSGETWEDYGATDSQKIALFSDGSTAFTIGKNSTAGGGGSEKMLRVTLLTKVASVYTTLNKAVIFINTNGTKGCYCTIRARLQSNYENEVDTWTTFIDKAPIAGWSGYNVLNFSSFSTYGNNKSSQYGQIQFIFGCTGSSSGSTPRLSVSKIFCFGGTGWTVPSNMAQNGHIYSWDSDQNTYFPKAVYPPAAGALLGSSSRRWNLYASNGHFSSAVSMTSTLSVAGATTLANLTVGSSNSITLGNGVLTWDATNSAWKLTSNLYATGFISAFGVSSTSDARLKKDFLDTTLTVDDIAHAPAITFLWKDREGKRQAGSLAQYWETVLPEVVTDIEGKKGLDYGAAALVSAITIARDVNDHEKRIRELERENRELKRRLGYADR